MAYLDDIEAQPELVAELMTRLADSQAVDRVASWIATSRGVWLAGMGSSYAAALYGSYVLAGPDRWACAFDAGELLHYAHPSSLPPFPLIAISQSGASFETARLAEKLKGRLPLIAITNVPDSPLAALSDLVLVLDVPSDEAISVKTYTATLTTIAVLAARTGGLPPVSPERVRESMRAVVSRGQQIAEQLAPLLDGRAISVVARGPSLASAFFGALLFKEAAGRPAEPITGGQFRHGPIELAGLAHAGLVLAPSGATAELQRRLAVDLLGYGSSVVFVGPPSAAPPQVAAPGRLGLWTVPELPDGWSPLVEACALQWLAWACGARAGRVVGRLERTPRVVDHE